MLRQPMSSTNIHFLIIINLISSTRACIMPFGKKWRQFFFWLASSIIIGRNVYGCCFLNIGIRFQSHLMPCVIRCYYYPFGPTNSRTKIIKHIHMNTFRHIIEATHILPNGFLGWSNEITIRFTFKKQSKSMN